MQIPTMWFSQCLVYLRRLAISKRYLRRYLVARGYTTTKDYTVAAPEH